MSEKGAMEFKCPACGGPLNFDPKSGKLLCEYCMSSYTKEEVMELAGDKGDEAADSYGSEAAQMKAYHCDSCGAELIGDTNSTAYTCPYCGNNTIVAAKFDEEIKPDYVIPFRHTKKEATEKYLEYSGSFVKRMIMPSAFTNAKHIDDIQGVYVPFWLFSGKASIKADLETSETHRSGDYKVTKHYQEHIEGTMNYNKIPADASVRMADELMDSVEPYDLTELEPFTMAYFPGFLAEKFDVNSDEEKDRVKKRIAGTIREKTREKAEYDIDEEAYQYRYKNAKTEYAFLPVWLLSTNYEGKTWQFAMNGQTGEMTGNLPMSKGRTTIFTALFALIGFLIGFLATKAVVPGVIGAVIVGLIALMILHGYMKPVAQKSNADRYMDDELAVTDQTCEYTKTTREYDPVKKDEPAKNEAGNDSSDQ